MLAGGISARQSRQSALTIEHPDSPIGNLLPLSVSSNRRTQREQGECRKPVFAHVVAREMRNAGAKMRFARLHSQFAYRIGCRQRTRDPTPTPCPAQIQSIEMHDPAVGPIAHLRGRE